MPGVAQPLEQHHLRRHDLRAVLSCPLQRGALVRRRTATPPHPRPGTPRARPPAGQPPSAARTRAPRTRRSPPCGRHRAAARETPGPARPRTPVLASVADGYPASSGTVGPRPAGYCSVARTGTSSSRAASARRTARATMTSPSARAGTSFACRSISSSTESAAVTSTPQRLVHRPARSRRPAQPLARQIISAVDAAEVKIYGAAQEKKQNLPSCDSDDDRAPVKIIVFGGFPQFLPQLYVHVVQASSQPQRPAVAGSPTGKDEV